MLISCEKCSTTYVLDDGLIPPGGAPVQCTRCGNVFTARPGGGSEATPPPAPVAPAPAAPRSDAASQTMMFGAAPVTSAPPPPAAAPSRAASQTMVFGSPAVAAAGASAPAPAPAVNTTMMFGTPAANAAAAAAAAAPPNSPKPNQTMVFGSGSPAAAPKPPPPTFGPPQTAGKEVVFGAPSTGAGAPPSHNQTMMFGLKAPVAGEPSAPPPAAPAAKPVATTAMFGAVQATGPIPQASTKAPNSTMMFGKPPPEAAAPPEANLNKTMAFGMPALPPPPSSVGRSTMIFGAADASKPPMPKVTPGGAPVAQITESTVRVDLDAMMRERGQAGEAEASPDRHNRTQLFAMNEARGGEKTPPEAFASPLAGEANLNTGSVGQAPGVRHERTQLFSMTPGSKPAGNVPASREFSNDVTLPPDGAMRTTMMFGATNNADTAPGLPGVTPELLRQPISSDGATTGPNLVPLIVKDLRSSPLERSFETTDTDSPIRSSDSSQDLAPHAEDSLEGNEQAFAAIESSTRRRNTIAVIVLLVAVLAAGSAVAWQFYLRPMLGGETPTKVMVPKGEKPEKAEKVEKTEKPAKE